MNPIYKFELTANGTTQRAFPIYKNDLAKDFEKESGQEFFRAKLSGNLTFESNDYNFIVSQAFDTQFALEIFISYNAGQLWTSYWRGNFWKTDCDFDDDTQTVSVNPGLDDIYTAILNGWEKEFNLIDLTPEIVNVKIDKRPMIQVYIPGQTVIGCFLSGMGWEQECESIDDESALQDTFKFYPIKRQRVIEVSGSMTPSLPPVFMGLAPENETGTYSYSASGFTYQYNYTSGRYTITIIRNSDSVNLWQYDSVTQQAPPEYPRQFTLSPVSGSGASGNVVVYIHDISVFARYICDVDEVLGVNTFDIPANDIVINNRNYKKVIGYDFPDSIIFSSVLTTTPTPYGIYQPGQYYSAPPSWYFGEVFPIAKSSWGRVSLWFSFFVFDHFMEESARAQYILKDAYPLASVISVLLGKIAPEITHQQNVNYSQFLYGTNPISGMTLTPVITPKSNLIYSGYDQPAQKAPITLKRIFDMLRDCFRCYWFIDSNNRLIIEHIKYFNNGMSYSSNPGIGDDLTNMAVSRNGKKWDFAKNKYQYDKPEMTARYQFGWMDDATQLFTGYPIDIISNYVQKDKIENIDIQNFSSDVDYILLNPSVISKDGFGLLMTNSRAFSIKALSFNQGGIQYDRPIGTDYAGMLNGSSTRISSIPFDVEKPIKITPVSGYKYFITYFDTNDRFIGHYSNSWQTTQKTINTSAKKIVITVAKTNNAAIVPADAQNINIVISDAMLQLPYYNDGDIYLQNGYAAFVYLQRFYLYDLPAQRYSINGIENYALGIKKLKTQQLNYPLLNDPDLQKLVKTNLGNGKIRKLSLNLSSRNAQTTLEYDTE